MFWVSNHHDKVKEDHGENDHHHNDGSGAPLTPTEDSHKPQHASTVVLEDLEEQKRRNDELEAQISVLKQKQEAEERQKKQKQTNKKTKQGGGPGRRRSSSISSTGSGSTSVTEPMTVSSSATVATSSSSRRQRRHKHHHHHHHMQPKAGEMMIPRKDLVALQTQVEGYKQLVDALTVGRPAMEANVNALQHPKIKYSSTNSTSSSSTSGGRRSLTEPNVLPLHVVRFLELMPYHPIAQEAALVEEELFEWQVYNPASNKKQWESALVYFPTFFKALPIIQPQEDSQHHTDHDSQPGVWTDQFVSKRFDLSQHGYFLPNPAGPGGNPNEPSWKWIGNWQVDFTLGSASTTSSINAASSFDSDDSRVVDDHMINDDDLFVDGDGWTYAKEAGHFLDVSNLIPPSCVPEELAGLSSFAASISSSSKHGFGGHHHHHTAASNSSSRKIMIRRRKWIRKRCLVDYPMACQQTVEYLALKAAQEELLYTNRLLQDKLQKEMDTANEVRATLAQQQESWNQERTTLQRRLKELEQETKQYQDSVQRQRGPPIQQFSFVNHNKSGNQNHNNVHGLRITVVDNTTNLNAPKVLEDDDDDDDTIVSVYSDTSSSSSECESLRFNDELEDHIAKQERQRQRRLARQQEAAAAAMAAAAQQEKLLVVVQPQQDTTDRRGAVEADDPAEAADPAEEPAEANPLSSEEEEQLEQDTSMSSTTTSTTTDTVVASNTAVITTSISQLLLQDDEDDSSSPSFSKDADNRSDPSADDGEATTVKEETVEGLSGSSDQRHDDDNHDHHKNFLQKLFAH